MDSDLAPLFEFKRTPWGGLEKSKQTWREGINVKEIYLNESLKCISSLKNPYKSDQRVPKETTIDLMNIF